MVQRSFRLVRVLISPGPSPDPVPGPVPVPAPPPPGNATVSIGMSVSRLRATTNAITSSSTPAPTCQASDARPEIGSSWCGEYLIQNCSSGGLSFCFLALAAGLVGVADMAHPD